MKIVVRASETPNVSEYKRWNYINSKITQKLIRLCRRKFVTCYVESELNHDFNLYRQTYIEGQKLQKQNRVLKWCRIVVRTSSVNYSVKISIACFLDKSIQAYSICVAHISIYLSNNNDNNINMEFFVHCFTGED